MDYKEIKKLMDDMGNSKLSEIEIEFPDGIKISMKKDSGNKLPPPKPVMYENGELVVPEQPGVPAVKEAAPLTEVKVDENQKVVKSPMVGTFYSKSAPTSEPYVSVGSKVKKGDILCIIEAMKLMNEIECEYDGEIAEILVKDGDMVDYGKPLFVIK